MDTGLFGIEHSNRNNHWTKNCFNSSFPTSLACWFLENNIPVIYACLEEIENELQVVCKELSVRDVFNCGNRMPKDLYFDFESPFNRYFEYSDKVDNIDLVVKDAKNNEELSPLEIKLTVLPTSSTAVKPESEWGCEMVVRSATTSYCALGIWDRVHNLPGAKQAINKIFDKACASVEDWNNANEMLPKANAFCECLNKFESKFLDFQRPLIMEPFWKTKGQRPELDDNAFDIVVWSDLAFSRLFIDHAEMESNTGKGKKISRHLRSSLKMARCIWELNKVGSIKYDSIYRRQSYDNQTDKEFSVPGSVWRQYISTKRLIKPVVKKEKLELILDSRIAKDSFKPERRLDQTLSLYYLQK